MPLWWSCVLAAVAIVSLALVGRKNPWGWPLMIADQVLWAVYAVDTRQWPFLASTAVYGVVAARSWRRWRQEATTR